MKHRDVKNIEIDLLLEGILQMYGYDFRHYARASLKRRINSFLSDLQLKNVSELQAILLHQRPTFNNFILNMSITVTEMFRDPKFYLAFKKHVIPVLKTYPYFKVWHAGCATGEEVYSMAIVLYEAGILDKATLYATDFNPDAIEKAKNGIYPVDHIKRYTENYMAAGGESDFSQYYHAKYGSAKINDFLKKRITYSNHNLVTDASFGEMNVILCRNVLIYFNAELQDRVLNLFKNSLCHLGHLCLGSQESLSCTAIQNDFTQVDKKGKIYRMGKTE